MDKIEPKKQLSVMEDRLAIMDNRFKQAQQHIKDLKSELDLAKEKQTGSHK
jgi:chromosome segregation ATPase